MVRKTLTDELESSRVLIFNSRGAEAAPLLNEMGIDAAYLDAGEALYKEAAALVTQQKKEYQEQNQAYDKLYIEKDDAEKNYKRTLKPVRVLSRNDKDLQNRLGFQSGKTIAITQWIEAAIHFYNRLLNESAFLTKLAKFKVSTDRLKNEKLDELDDYCTKLKAIAEIALEKKPQPLEQLGIVVPP